MTPQAAPLALPPAGGTPAPAKRSPGRPRGTKTNPEVVLGGAGIAGREKVKTQIAMMAAAAVKPGAISRGLRLSKARITQILGQSDTQGMVDDFRKILRAHALSSSLDISVKGMKWLNEVLDNRDDDKMAPKAFELISRGMSNMEKVFASASGENRPQGVQVAVINQAPGETSAEIAKLVEMLVGPTP